MCIKACCFKAFWGEKFDVSSLILYHGMLVKSLGFYTVAVLNGDFKIMNKMTNR